MSDIKKDIRRFIIPALRRDSMRFHMKIDGKKVYPRTEALNRARIERGLYKCASCSGTFGPKEIVVDHIIAVIPLTGDTHDWNDFINALFVEADKLQILCNPCHDIKSSIEDDMRFQHRQKLRDVEKEEKKLTKLNKKLAKQKKV